MTISLVPWPPSPRCFHWPSAACQTDSTATECPQRPVGVLHHCRRVHSKRHRRPFPIERRPAACRVPSVAPISSPPQSRDCGPRISEMDSDGMKVHLNRRSELEDSPKSNPSDTWTSSARTRSGGLPSRSSRVCSTRQWRARKTADPGWVFGAWVLHCTWAFPGYRKVGLQHQSK